jgi:PPOX class probable F420-dependent enzyme
MPVEIPAQYLDLLTEPVVVAYVTINEDGSPQQTPVWCDYADGYVRVNTAAGRRKDRNVRANPNVGILAIDPSNPYRWLEVRGKVVEITEEGAVEHIDAMTKAYMGRDKFFTSEEAAARETRVMVKIEPLKVNAAG